MTIIELDGNDADPMMIARAYTMKRARDQAKRLDEEGRVLMAMGFDASELVILEDLESGEPPQIVPDLVLKQKIGDHQ